MEQISASGHVDAFLVSGDGKITKVVDGRNTLSYVCADAVAKLFAGNLSARPTQISFVYGPENETFDFTDGNRDQSATVGGELELHTVPISPNPAFSATSSSYTGNVVTLSAMTTDALPSGKTIYGVMLRDAAGGVLATKKFGTAVVKPSGYAMSVAWAVTFN